jgi:3-oxoacyl-[acyl-carrier protein] reductase
MELENKVALITGASSGIGAAIAERFATEGAHVCISYRKNKKGAESLKEIIEGHGGQALLVEAELTRDADAELLVAACVKEYGRIDIVVNNVGGYISGDEWDGDVHAWEVTMQQNLLSALSVSKYATQHFQEQKNGIFVNIASRCAMEARPYEIAYAAAKAGVVSMTQAYAKLLAPHGRANCISPGMVRAGYWLTAPEAEAKESLAEVPLGKLVEVTDIAEAALFLASDRARFITGHNLPVEGGYLMK